MLKIEIDQQMAERIYREMVAEKLTELQNEKVFWKTKELKQYTGMCWNTIQNSFFHNPDFPKFKCDGVWRFPAKECTAFLECWWKTQRRK